jgi:hypothetical protein
LVPIQHPNKAEGGASSTNVCTGWMSSNTDIWTTTNQKPMDLQIKEKKWKWIGHILRS